MNEVRFKIQPLKHSAKSAISTRIAQKTKPLGALGKLEALAQQLAEVLTVDAKQPILLQQPVLTVFAGDHGIATEGVSIAPSEVTGQMVANFANGGAAINVFCRQLGWQLQVVDCGILQPPAAHLAVISQRLGSSTAAFHNAPAMSEAQLQQGLSFGAESISAALQAGSNVFAFGEMGIGNTSSAAAIFSALSGLPASETVGKGTGVSAEVMAKKCQLITQALELHRAALTSPWAILRHLGGFEICQMVGAMLAVAQAGKVVLVDGFIATAAAMLAVAAYPACKEYLVFAHCSGEQGHQKMLDYLQVEALLNLQLRLGEGTGAALALPLLQCAAAFYNDMASFATAAVTEVNH
ncbi:nicotinate-nucleotide--dimethylbenzimidazole phosphoribosyltransferase [Pseudoalteromonas fenneropenaei]|uniref:Nicotinate-nucleotide--dimethylbenzimidazole phosphoribosyltransferase n=1 Tax=Pseudoalteromonas fenneropenaei TaxID=1737459 RepID=A0ABV7CL72_9GAMM